MNTTTRQIRNVLKSAMEMQLAPGQVEAAAKLYENVLSHDENNAEALHWLGLLHHQTGDNRRGRADDPASAVELRPSVAYLLPIKFGRGVTTAQGRGAGQPRAAGRPLVCGRITPRACTLGTTLTALKRHDEAVESLRRAVELRPTYVVAINNLGIALRELGQAKEALAQFRRAVELEPAFAPARTNLGQALLNYKEAEEALVHCQEAVRLDPGSAEMRDNLGNVLRALDRLDDAWGAHWEALRLDADLASANAHIGLILQRRGHLDRGVRRG